MNFHLKQWLDGFKSVSEFINSLSSICKALLWVSGIAVPLIVAIASYLEGLPRSVVILLTWIAFTFSLMIWKILTSRFQGNQFISGKTEEKQTLLGSWYVRQGEEATIWTFLPLGDVVIQATSGTPERMARWELGYWNVTIIEKGFDPTDWNRRPIWNRPIKAEGVDGNDGENSLHAVKLTCPIITPNL